MEQKSDSELCKRIAEALGNHDFDISSITLKPLMLPPGKTRRKNGDTGNHVLMPQYDIDPAAFTELLTYLLSIGFTVHFLPPTSESDFCAVCDIQNTCGSEYSRGGTWPEQAFARAASAALEAAARAAPTGERGGSET